MKFGRFRPLVCRIHALFNDSRIANRGQGNVVVLADSIRRACRIRISGNGNRIEIAPGCRFWDLDLEMVGDGHRLYVGANCQVRGGRWLLEDACSVISVGASTTMIGDTLIASEGTHVTLGEDCMLSSSVEVRSSDGHSILDRHTGKRMNPPQDITIGRHVWLAAGVRILKGVAVGEHSVVAAGAVVSKDLPAHCVAAGIPAQVLREGVTWDRRRIAE